MNTPLFSIIIPIYNVENYLRECIDSVLAQDFQDYEIILVDDGSPDRCGQICDEYASKFPQIKVIHKQNGGLSNARNFGIKAATGDYLVFLDSDDFWKGTHILSDVSEIINNENPDVVLHGYTGKSYTPLQNHINYTSCSFEYLVKNSIYVSNSWTKITKRNIILENNLFFQKGILHEDVPHSFDLAKYAKSYAVYSSNFYQYRTRKDSIRVHLKLKNIKDLFDTLNEKLDDLINNKDKNYYEGLKNYIEKNINYAFSHYLHLSYKDMFSLYTDATKVWNKSKKIWSKEELRTIFFTNRKLALLSFPVAILVLSFIDKVNLKPHN